MADTIRHLRDRKVPGSIVNIISIAELGGQPYLAPYVAAKAGLAGLTRNAAHAHRWDKIRINGIDIGWTATDTETKIQQTEHGAGDDWLAKANASVPMGRISRPRGAGRVHDLPALASCRRRDWIGHRLGSDRHRRFRLAPHRTSRWPKADGARSMTLHNVPASMGRPWPQQPTSHFTVALSKEIPVMRLGLIGLGRIGAFHAATLTELEAVESLVVYDAAPALVDAVVSRHGAEPAGSVEALLAADIASDRKVSEVDLSFGWCGHGFFRQAPRPFVFCIITGASFPGPGQSTWCLPRACPNS